MGTEVCPSTNRMDLSLCLGPEAPAPGATPPRGPNTAAAGPARGPAPGPAVVLEMNGQDANAARMALLVRGGGGGAGPGAPVCNGPGGLPVVEHPTPEALAQGLGYGPVPPDRTRSDRAQRLVDANHPGEVLHVGSEASVMAAELLTIGGVAAAAPVGAVLGVAAPTITLLNLLRNAATDGAMPHWGPAVIRTDEDLQAARATVERDARLVTSFDQGAYAGLRGQGPERPNDQAYMLGYARAQALREHCGGERIDQVIAAQPTLSGSRRTFVPMARR
ncbi:MAG: hypothetical protein HY909_20505 [Deltaproteobacteria bacterium]|nr:hypothetical protein [Deltaproteobacteria bacterium]